MAVLIAACPLPAPSKKGELCVLWRSKRLMRQCFSGGSSISPTWWPFSKTTVGNMWQDITLALGLKAVFLMTNSIGVTGLWPAIFADIDARCW